MGEIGLSEQRNILLANIKARLPELEALLVEAEEDRISENQFYRFHYGSWKIFDLQDVTEEIVKEFRSLAPNPEAEKLFDDEFEKIITSGTGREFNRDTTNKNWLEETGPIIAAFFHVREYLRLMVKYGKSLESSPTCLPYGWAAVLCLYRIR